MDKSAKTVRYLLLPPISVAMLLLIVVFAIMLTTIRRDSLRQSSRSILDSCAGEFYDSISEQSRALDAALSAITRDSQLRQDLRSGQAKQLLEANTDLYNKLRQAYGVTHFYFHGPDRVNILRLHKPDKNGDLINRVTTLGAENTMGPFSGLELGQLGTFTLRCVHPVVEDGELLGYVELGKEIEDIVSAIHRRHNVEILVLVKKSYLDKSQWATGMAMLGRHYDWDSLPDAALVYSSLQDLTDQCLVAASARAGMQHRDITEVDFGRKPWHVMSSPLRDVSGSVIGTFTVLRETTRETASLGLMIYAAIAVSIILLTFVVAGLDIVLRRTDRRLITQHSAIIESEQRLASTLRSIGDAVISADAEGRILSLNPVAQRLLGWNDHEATGKYVEQVFNIIDPVTHEKLADPVRSTLAAGEGVKIKDYSVLVSRQGNQCRISDSCEPVCDEHGSIIGVVLVFRDVSKDYDQIEKLRVSRERFAQVCDHIGELVWEVDRSGYYVYANQAWKTLLGYDPQDIVDKMSMFDMHPEDGREEFKLQMRACFDKEAEFSEMAHQLEAKDGHVIDVLNHGVPVLSAQGKLLGYRGAAMDVTELRRANEVLEQRVAERSEDVYRLLRQTDEFVNRLGHDLRTPLTPLVALLPLVKERCEDEASIKMLRLSMDGVEYMQKLVESVLLLAKLNAGSHKVSQVVVNLASVADDVIYTLVQQAEESQIEIINRIDRSIHVLVDVTDLMEVFKRLLDNAIRFNEEPGAVTIDASKDDKNITISIVDTGIGMTTENVSRAFEEFYKADDSRHDRNCSGLGLCICRKIINRHGGDIRLMSPGLGKGTTVSFTLTLATDQDGAVQNEQEHDWLLSAWKG